MSAQATIANLSRTARKKPAGESIGRPKRKGAIAKSDPRGAVAGAGNDARIEQLWAARAKLIADWRASLNDATAQSDKAFYDKICSTEDQIEAIPITSPTKAAAMFMIALQHDGGGLMEEQWDREYSIAKIASGLLPLIYPHLQGLIGRHVGTLLARPPKPLCELEFCI